MAHFLFQTTLFWLGSALVFEFFLKKLTMHSANRAFLISMSVAGICWPFLQKTISGWLSEDQIISVVLPVFEVGGLSQLKTGAKNLLDFQTIFWSIWAIGFLAGLARIVVGFWQIFQKRKDAETALLPGKKTLFRVTKNPQPFSFFNQIFIDKSLDINELEAQQIIAHERAHGQLGHSFDLLFFEILRAFFWFHPFVYWAKKRLRDVHEFEADEAVAGQFSRKQYGVLLLQSLAGEAARRPAVALTNSFFSSSIKSRIMMLSRKKSGAFSRLNYLLLLPIGLFLLIFQQKQLSAQSSSKLTKFELVEVTDTIVTFDPATFVETVQFVKTMSEQKTDEKNPNGFYKNGDEMPEFPGGMAALSQFLVQNIKYPEAARKAKIDGNVLISFIVEKDGTLTNFRELKSSPDPTLFAEALRVAKLMPKWVPGTVDGKPVRVQFALPVKFALD